jgi:hypothetical protein
MDYAPETTMDPSFTDIAVGCGVVCRVHNLEPRNVWPLKDLTLGVDS